MKNILTALILITLSFSVLATEESTTAEPTATPIPQEDSSVNPESTTIDTDAYESSDGPADYDTDN